MFCPSGYNCLRCDRTGKKGGGVVAFYKSGLTVNEVNIYPVSNAKPYEVLCFDVYFSDEFVRFVCVYIPPDQSAINDVVIDLCNTLKSLVLTDAPLFILGDFNFPDIDWNIPSCPDNSYSDRTFLDFCSNYSLTQCIDYPTHDQGNILDLLLYNDKAKHLINNHFISSPPWHTDHFLISANITLQRSQRNAGRNFHSYPDFKSCDYGFISNLLLHSDWNFCYQDRANIQQIYDDFILVLNKIISHHVPLKSNRFNPKSQPKHLRKLIRQKKTLYKKMKSDKSLKSEYKKASKAYDRAVNQWRDKIESNLCSNPNSKKFYKFINNKFKSSHTIPPLNDDSNELVFSDLDKANLFNSSFQKFFTLDNGSSLPHIPPLNHMSPFHITPSDILKASSKMKSKLSRTPEGIPSYFIVRVINALIQPITAIFNLSLYYNVIPSQWKNALVIPIFKKGDRRSANNYRPVSLTSSFSRLFELVLLDKMMAYVQEHELISPLQFGFLPRRSSCTQLLSCLYDWLRSYCRSESMSVLYTDITKAFDSVNHRLLLQVLYQYGFNNQIVLWLQNFLTNRQQQVCINGATSSPLAVLSGVPQGSVIGPFLFIVFLNGITEFCSDKVHMKMFADDSKLFSTSCNDLQNSMNLICSWLNQHQLVLAPHKCAVLKIKKKGVDDNSEIWIDDHPVGQQLSVKDLGVFISSDMKWATHINSICHKASVRSFQLLKTIQSRNIWTFKKLFITYIRPQLEYNSQIWSPYLQEDINRVETIQRNFTKKAFERCNIPFSSYEDRLIKMDILSLQSRREFLDLLFLYKLINNFYDLDFNTFFSFKPRTYFLRTHSLQITLNDNFKSKLDQWTNSFYVRTPKLWNSLPENIVKCKSITSFKSFLKTHFLSKLT